MIAVTTFLSVIGCSEAPPPDPRALQRACGEQKNDEACLRLSEVPGTAETGTWKIYALSTLCHRDAQDGCRRLYDLRNVWENQTDIQVALGGICGSGVASACEYSIQWDDEDPSILDDYARTLTEVKLAELREAR